MITTFTIERLRLMPRPPEYLDELRACATEVTDIAMTFETDNECYQALLKKYRPKVAPESRPVLAKKAAERTAERQFPANRPTERKGCGCGKSR